MENYCLNSEQEFTPDVQSEAENTAQRLLKANWLAVQRIAEALEKRGQLKASEIVGLCRDPG
jgi:hypothetical protein